MDIDIKKGGPYQFQPGLNVKRLGADDYQVELAVGFASVAGRFSASSVRKMADSLLAALRQAREEHDH